jgi:hypothetical protein
MEELKIANYSLWKKLWIESEEFKLWLELAKLPPAEKEKNSQIISML